MKVKFRLLRLEFPLKSTQNALLNQLGSLCSIRRSGQFVGQGGALQMPNQNRQANRRRQGGFLQRLPLACFDGHKQAATKGDKEMGTGEGKTSSTQ